MWSRVRSVPDLSDASEIRLRHMFFEDFLEALVRMSTLMAFPTDEELAEVGAADAGEFLLAMQVDAPNDYRAFLDTHRPKHKDPDGSDFEQHQLQPIWRCVAHLVTLLVRTVEFNTSALRNSDNADGAVQAYEARKFIRSRTQGGALHRQAGALKGTDFQIALDSAAVKVLTTTAAIKIQMSIRAKRARRKVQERRAAKFAREAGAAMCIQRLLRCRRARNQVAKRRWLKEQKDASIARFWQEAEESVEQLDLRLR